MELVDTPHEQINVRDQAAMHDDSRMDEDVLRERQLISKGLDV